MPFVASVASALCFERLEALSFSLLSNTPPSQFGLRPSFVWCLVPGKRCHRLPSLQRKMLCSIGRRVAAAAFCHPTRSATQPLLKLCSLSTSSWQQFVVTSPWKEVSIPETPLPHEVLSKAVKYDKKIALIDVNLSERGCDCVL